MFERYTEHARRVIFFARYEASTFGSSLIETEHLLLALLREDRNLAGKLPQGAGEAIRKRIEELTPPRNKISTSVDIPLSHDSKRVLAFSDEEAIALNHKVISSGHLTLGLLRMERCPASALLRDYGIDLDKYRAVVETSHEVGTRVLAFHERAVDRPNPEAKTAKAPSLQPAIDSLSLLVDRIVNHMDTYSDVRATEQLKRLPWSRKEALGNLVDWASAHHGWLAKALTEPKLVASGYPDQDWVSAQNYDAFSWKDLVDLWVCINRLLIHVIAQIPEEKASMTCKVGINLPVPLMDLIARYHDHCDDIAGQILAKL